MPQLSDPNFSQTTTLLSAFNKEGAMGVVLNRPLDIELSDIFDSEEEFPAIPKNLKAHWGGPVQNQVGWIIHEDSTMAKESVMIEEGLFLNASSSGLKKLLQKGTSPNAPRFRFFLGYAGWAAGQLEKEIAASSWVTAPIDREFVFSRRPETVWRESLNSIGVDPANLASVPQGQAH